MDHEPCRVQDIELNGETNSRTPWSVNESGEPVKPIAKNADVHIYRYYSCTNCGQLFVAWSGVVTHFGKQSVAA